jgi:hypothetical protein
MNERIEELAKQARAWAETAYKNQNEKFTSHWDTPVGYTPSQFFEQKFAELIVRACADAGDMAYDARCPYIGDYIGEQMGYGEEHGIANWRHEG